MFLKHLNQLNSLLGENGVLILESGEEKKRTFSSYYPFRVDNNFYYLSGFNEPHSILMVLGGKKKAQTILFCRKKDKEKEMWEGFRFGPQYAKKTFHFTKAFPIESFSIRFAEFLKNKTQLFWAMGENKELDDFILKTLENLKKESKKGLIYPHCFQNARNLMQQLRIIKTEEEMLLMKKAAQISDGGHIRAMQKVRPAMWEYQLEAELSYAFRQNGGAELHAYAPIVAGGKNACILHYSQNNQILNDQDLVLIDAGAEYQHYAADITRTFPVNGQFTPEQKIIYEMVLNAQKEAISLMKEGIDFNTPHLKVIRLFTEGLMDLKIIEKMNIDNAIEKGDWQKFYMHGTSHFLGMDVHDLGEYKQNKKWVHLKKGMVLTVEPGLYFNEKDLPLEKQQFKNIGIRIEDNVLIQKNHAEIYTQAPKEIKEIEDLMRENPR